MYLVIKDFNWIIQEYAGESPLSARGAQRTFSYALLKRSICSPIFEIVRFISEEIAPSAFPPASGFQSAAWSQGIFAPDQTFFAVHGSSGSAQKGWDGASPSGRNTASHR